ncbi:hypothetical protein Acsp03_66430 [Actinomadura sp. NBRC 104412]|nr:hypothetical protein Acsp03_66430 [Actinomadura sp. NBRC 104412]
MLVVCAPPDAGVAGMAPDAAGHPAAVVAWCPGMAPDMIVLSTVTNADFDSATARQGDDPTTIDVTIAVRGRTSVPYEPAPVLVKLIAERHEGVLAVPIGAIVLKAPGRFPGRGIQVPITEPPRGGRSILPRHRSILRYLYRVSAPIGSGDHSAREPRFTLGRPRGNGPAGKRPDTPEPT